MHDLEQSKVNLNNEGERNEVEAFLKEYDLILDKDVDYTIVIRDKGIIKATCSKAKNVLKCFAVAADLRGEGITSTLISALIDKQFEEGIYHSFIFTKPNNIDIFASLNYKLIHKVKDVALLENGITNINGYLDSVIKKYSLSSSEKSALVMNCNPFTLGHRYLIEEASKASREVLVFIVQEEKSLFPFEDRYELVKEGVSDLKNVKVIPGGEYIISSATFPSYFLREEGTKLKAYTELDAGIFCRYFCSRLNITKRFVGTEPYCKVTKVYNEALKDTLEQYGIELLEIERIRENNYAISASRVREYIKQESLKEMSSLLPEVTLKFLNTERGKEIMERIKHSSSPH